jgi:hypothetical protein
VRADRHDGGDQDQVHGVLSGGRCADPCEHTARAVAVQRRRRRAGGGRGEREHGDVVRHAHGGPVLQQLGDGRCQEDDEQACGPAEEDDRGDTEDERQRDAAGVHALDRNREPVGERRGEEQRGQAEQRRGLVRRDRKGHDCCASDPEAGRANG